MTQGRDSRKWTGAGNGGGSRGKGDSRPLPNGKATNIDKAKVTVVHAVTPSYGQTQQGGSHMNVSAAVFTPGAGAS